METNTLPLELAKMQTLKECIPDTIGVLSIKTANQSIKEAQQRPDPAPLWLSLWYEGEVCCSFSDSNLGKSIYSVQIATEIAKRQKVLYFDFELSDKQFQLRYTGENGELYKFPENLLRVEISKEHFDTDNFESSIIDSIEEAAVITNAKVLIIDNLTYLCTAAEKGDVAGSLMMKLLALKRKYGLSIMVIAHTPKRQLSSPITQNDLAGSKKLFNFFDSVFAIGKSAKGNNLRYVKQIKVRYGEYEYDEENVIVYSIEKFGAFLQFSHVEYGVEREHLKEQTQSDREEKTEEVKRLQREGKSQREIATLTGLSLGCVNKYLRN